MNHLSKKIVFFGTDGFSVPTLQRLIDYGYNVVAVVTKPDSKRGRGHKLTAPGVKLLAQQHNIDVLQPDKVTQIADYLQNLGDDVVGILSSFGKIIPKSIIDIFTPGIINIHPSLLPKYRGSSPIESAIINNDEETGASIMLLTAGVDTGPVYAKTVLPLAGTETQPELRDTLSQLGAETLIGILPDILNNSLMPVSQDDDLAIYCSLLEKSDAWLKPDEMTAKEAECKVRAHLTFPRTKFKVLGHDVIITKAHVSSTTESNLDIRCSDNNYLVIDELVAPSGRAMTAKNFINGYS
jgi:methionyl-tRNA formyltransferase